MTAHAPRTILIGDIHGCYAELEALLAAVELQPEDHLVSVGDLVDRGPEPTKVVRLFQTRPNSTALMGNHERKHVRGVLSYSQQITRLQMGEAYADAVAWMATLPYHYEDEQVRVVHWGLYPGVPLEEVPEEVRSGTTSGEGRLRERYGARPWHESYTDDKPVVFGHAVMGAQPLVRDGKVYGLDTGACHGLRLTALVLPEGRIVSVPAREDHWARARRAWEEPVLRQQRWGAMTWEQLLKRIAKARDPEHSGDYLDRVAGWAAALRGQIPELAAQLDAENARLLKAVGEEGYGRAAAEHAAGSHLIRLRAGRIGRENLGCAGPAELVALAAKLGSALPTEP